MTIHPYWMGRDRESPRIASNWYALGMLRPGVRWSDAQSEMNGIAHQLAVEHPENRNRPEIRVVPLDVQTSGRLRLPLAVLFCAVLLMLLIACLNVANLLLANGSAREREFSVRRALGGSRVQIAVQLLIESLVLSVAGGALGLGLAAILLKGLVAWGPREIPRLSEARIDSSSLLFTLGLCLFTALFFGLAPALQTGATPARSRVWTTVSASKLRTFLVVGEFAVALVLLTGAGLMVRSFVALHNVNLGFRPAKLLVMRIDLHVGRTSEQQAEYFRQVIDRLQALPGVRSAAAITGFLRTDPEDSVEIQGRPRQNPGPCDDLVAGPFLQTAGIPLRKGRYLNDQDRRGSTAVALVNEAMAKAYWPNEDAIGKRFRFPSHGWSPWMTVVGITGDARRHGIEINSLPQVLRPNAQEPEDMLDVIVRTVGDPEPIGSSAKGDLLG